MGKKKNVQALAAAAGSSGSADSEDITYLKTRNAMLMKEVKERRKQIQHLQHRIATATLELTVAAGKKNAVKRELNHLSDSSQMKAKSEKAWKLQTKNVTAAGVSEAAESSKSNEIKNLKVLNEQLVQEVAERRKQIGQLRLELDTLTADHDIMTGMMRDVFGLVLSSALSEAAARKNVEMAAVTKKAQWASSELNATKTRLLDLAGEKDAIQRDMECIVEESNSTLLSLGQAKSHPGQDRRTWKKWIYPVAVVSFSIATTIVILCKGSNIKN